MALFVHCVVAHTCHTAILERRREYGIVKAIGARGWFLLALTVRQTMIVSAVGLVAGGVFFLGARAVIASVRPQFVILATARSVGQAVGAALLMGLIASVVPARRLARLEPAVAYGGA